MVILDAAFVTVLATVLLLGDAFGDIDQRDFPGPASDALLGIVGLALWALALGLMTIVKNDAVSDTLLGLIAAANAGFALLLTAWALLADGFSPVAQAIVWVTVAVLATLAASQLLLRGTERPPRSG